MSLHILQNEWKKRFFYPLVHKDKHQQWRRALSFRSVNIESLFLFFLSCLWVLPFASPDLLFLNKTEHRDLRRQVTTRDEAKRSEQGLPTSEISSIFAAPAGIVLWRSPNGCNHGCGSYILNFVFRMIFLIINRWRDETIRILSYLFAVRCALPQRFNGNFSKWASVHVRSAGRDELLN